MSAFESVTFELNTALRIGDWRPIVRLDPGLQDVAATAVEHGFFDTLGVPVRGRSFRPEEDLFGASPVGIISERLSRRLATEGWTLGADLKTTRGPVTVVGIAPKGFHGPRLGDQTDLWITLGALPAFSDMAIDPGMRAFTPLAVFARLRPGTALEAAQDQVRAVLDRRTTLQSLQDVPFPLRSHGAVARQRTLVKTLWIAAILVLLLGAANLAALLIARTSRKRHHWAVKLSLGSTRGALVREVVGEMAIIAAAGLLAGLIFRTWLLQSVDALDLAVTVTRLDISLDARVLLFSVGIVALSIGIASAGALLQASRADLSAVLATASSTGTRQTAFARQTLLAAHVALATALLVAAIALVATVRQAFETDLGIVRDRTVFARVRPSLTQYMSDPQNYVRARQRDYVEALSRISALPSVTAATYGAPMLQARREAATTTLLSVDGVARRVPLSRYEVGPGYLAAAGARFVEGRDLTAADADAAPTRQEMMKYVTLRRLGRSSGTAPAQARSPAVIDTALAELLWPGQNATGKTLTWTPLQMTHEVVGVVAELGRRPAREAAVPTLLVPVPLSSYEATAPYSLIASTRGDASRETAAIGAVLRELFPEAPLLEVKTVRQLIAAQMAQERMGARIFSWYAIAAAILGLIGIYGLLVSLAVQARRELAIRSALGARSSELVRLIVAGVLGPVTFGVLAGLVLSTLLNQALGTTVIGLNQAGVMAQAGAAGIFLVAAVVVTSTVARRIIRINAAQILQEP